MTTSFETELKEKGFLVYRTKGISMLPLLRENKDLVIIERPKQLAKDDTVLFRRDNGTYVLHRIVSGCPEHGWIICGDNLLQMERVRHEQIIGIMTAFVRDGIKTPVTDAAYRCYVRNLHYRRTFRQIRASLTRAVRLPLRFLSLSQKEHLRKIFRKQKRN